MEDIREEKIINGVKTVFNYKRNMIGMKGKLTSKDEYLQDKIVNTHYHSENPPSQNGKSPRRTVRNVFAFFPS